MGDKAEKLSDADNSVINARMQRTAKKLLDSNQISEERYVEVVNNYPITL